MLSRIVYHSSDLSPFVKAKADNSLLFLLWAARLPCGICLCCGHEAVIAMSAR